MNSTPIPALLSNWQKVGSLRSPTSRKVQLEASASRDGGGGAWIRVHLRSEEQRSNLLLDEGAARALHASLTERLAWVDRVRGEEAS